LSGEANGRQGAPGDYLLETKNLKMHFPIKAGVLRRTVGHVKAVDGVDLQIRRSETLGLVGESGCGKSTLARLILRLLEPTEGEVIFEGENILAYDRRRMLAVRRNMQIIFQDPYASLNPRMTVGGIVGEPLKTHRIGEASDRKKRVQELLEVVGLSPEHYNRYPHEFSGGQRQRIGVARAIALNPKLIICDEPVSALDVSIQAQVINLLQDLQRDFDLTYVFIAHDLSVVKHISDRVAVMYLGKIVEITDRRRLYGQPRHPYTTSLLSAIPIPDPENERQRRRIVLAGDVPSPANPPQGCSFHTRCPRAQEYCVQHEPGLIPQDGGPDGEADGAASAHRAACFFPVEEGQPIEEPAATTPYRAGKST
jgi:oligopeptide/dipeptide ABC transporter ATP-binding protein